MRVDAETEMMNVGAEEATVIYNYRLVNTDASAITANQMQAALRPKVVNYACTHPGTREEFLNKGITLRYVYHDKIRRRITSFDVTKKSCAANGR